MKKNFILLMGVIAFAMGVVSCNSRQTTATETTTDEAVEVVDTLLVEDTTVDVTDEVVEVVDSTDVE